MHDELQNNATSGRRESQFQKSFSSMAPMAPPPKVGGTLVKKEEDESVAILAQGFVLMRQGVHGHIVDSSLSIAMAGVVSSNMLMAA